MNQKKENEFVKNLEVDQRLDDVFFAVSKVEAKTAQNGNLFVNLSLGDKTGYQTALFWVKNEEEQNRIVDTVKLGNVVRIKGYVKKGSGGYPPSIWIESKNGGYVLLVQEADYAIEDFKGVTKWDVEELIQEVNKQVSEMQNPGLKNLCNHFLDDEKFLGAFKTSPAAKTHHHNCIGGLLSHTVEVIKICNMVLTFHPELDRDLLITGVILHDIGKIESYSYEKAAIVLTEKNDLIGHLALGSMTVKEAITTIRNKGIDFPSELENRVLHLILSHHGQTELNYGSVIDPQIPEAIVLFHADSLDSQTEGAISKQK